jgi:putative ABC transport system ATP-binding protein
LKGPQNSHAEAVLLEARQLSRVDLPSQATLLAPTDFCLRAGERIALIGASGSGKSVLLRTLALLDAPSSGEVLWLGEPLTPPLIPNFRARACYLTQRAALVDGSIMDNLRLPFTLKHNRHRRFDAALAVRLLELAG